MKNYTPSEIALAVGVSASSIRNWTEQSELQPYLSDRAVRRNQYEHAKQREYTQEDLYVLNTIAKAKSRHNTWQDVADLLGEGTLYKDLPPSAALVMQETAAEGFADKIMLHQRIEFLEETVKNQELEIETLLTKVDEVRSTEREEARAEREELQGTINELYRLVGKLEAKIEMLKEDQDR